MGGIRHAFISSKTDGGDATLVRPSDWNAEHATDTKLATWVDRTDRYTSEGVEFNSGFSTVANDLGPNGENVIETTINLGTSSLLNFQLPPGSIVKVDLYIYPTQGGGSVVHITTGGVQTNISTATAASWARVVRYMTVGSDGLFRLGITWQHRLANIHFTLLGERHLYDSWVDGTGVITSNGVTLTNVTRQATAAPDGSALLETASGSGPNTIVTYTGLPAGADVVIDMIRDPASGGGTYFQAVVESGTYVVGTDSVTAMWAHVVSRVPIGSDGQMVLRSTYGQTFFDFRVYIVSRAAGSGDVLNEPNFLGEPGWTNIGANITTLDMNTTVPGHAYIKVTPPNTTTFGWVGSYRAWSPSAGDTFTVRVHGHKMLAQFQEIGIFAADAAGSKASCFGRYASAATTVAYHWRDFSTLTNSVNDGSVGGDLGRFGEFWLRIKWNSNTSLDFQYSHDGFHFIDAFAAHVPASAFTTNAVGIYVMPYGTVTPTEGLFCNWELT